MHASLTTLALLAATAGAFPSPVSSLRQRSSTAAVPAGVITFRSTNEVRGRAIHLADIALVECPDRNLSARLEAVEVGTSPLCGHSRAVSAEYAKIRIRQIGVNPDRLLFRGADLVTVTRPEQLLAGSELAKVAQTAAEAAVPGAAAEITYMPRDLRLPVGAVTTKALPVKLAGETGGSVMIQVSVDGQEAASTPVSFRIQRRAPVVVAARDLPAGSVLSSDDVRLEERPVLPGRLVLSEDAQAVGQQAAIPVKAGTVLTASQLKPPLLIRRGTRIRLVCKGPSFIATATGEALQDGAAGQTIRVRNLASLRELAGLVVDDQTAEVPF